MYDEKRKTLKAKVRAVNGAWLDWTKKRAYADLETFLESVKPPSHHQKLDPNKLPNRELEVIKREPRKTKEEFAELAGDIKISPVAWDWFARKIAQAEHGDRVKIASTGFPFGLLPKKAVTFTPIDIMDTVIAQTGGDDLPTTADLTPTIEAQSDRQSIIDLAAELNNSPSEIYNWVYNNIEYVPTWGSIQGAEMCMLAKKCNDMDTASLLIALLRASDIPARYIHGVIELPIDKVMNWVGGFTDVDSAVSFIASGGTPVLAINQGGSVANVQMEHIWVEAYVDYIPSRGAVHITGDSWVPLDGSYKQYVYTEGVDLQSEVPFDAEAFVDQAMAGASTDAVTGAVTGVNLEGISQSFFEHLDLLLGEVSAANPGVPISEWGFKKEVINDRSDFLPSGNSVGHLPDKVVYSTTPDQLRHKITFSVTTYPHLGSDFEVTRNVAEIAGKKVALVYPSTGSSSGTYHAFSYGNASYLSKVRPVLKIDDEVVATGGAIGAAYKHEFAMTFSSPYYAPDTMIEDVFAGEFYYITINPSTFSRDVLNKSQSELQQFTTSSVGNDVFYDNFYQSIFHYAGTAYYASLDAFTKSTSNALNTRDLRQVSRAFLKKSVVIGYLYGLPLSINEGGAVLDVDRDVRSMRSTSGVNFDVFISNGIRGFMASNLEHLTLELIFGGTAISTAKVLLDAAAMDIPIYTIDANNYLSVIPVLSVSNQVKEEIISSVKANNIVIIPGHSLTVNHWTGIAYEVINQSTGQGAYMISSGNAGSDACHPENKTPDLCWDEFRLLTNAQWLYNTSSSALIGLAVGAIVSAIAGYLWVEKAYYLPVAYEKLSGPLVEIAYGFIGMIMETNLVVTRDEWDAKLEQCTQLEIKAKTECFRKSFAQQRMASTLGAQLDALQRKYPYLLDE